VRRAVRKLRNSTYALLLQSGTFIPLLGVLRGCYTRVDRRSTTRKLPTASDIVFVLMSLNTMPQPQKRRYHPAGANDFLRRLILSH
jgi:hypothetical protein